ncbi:MAG: hypothetical protein ACI9WU_002363, partial [Myxococcota bacterium]
TDTGTTDTGTTDTGGDDLSCAAYCAGVQTACTGDSAQYASEADCLSYCSDWSQLDMGTVDDTDGNTVGCRMYHASVASESDENAAIHCVHAGPSGGNVCGTWCDNYCDLSATNCGADNELYADDDACMTACGNFVDTGDAGATAGDSVQCRIYHLGVAGSDADVSAAIHCSHGGIDGDGICADVDPTPTCAAYCDSVMVSCPADGDTAQYADMDSCLSYCTTWGQLALGTLDDIDGNTVGCRMYHSGVAASDLDNGSDAIHCPHAGPHGGNVCGSWCDNYCDLAMTNCGGANELYADADACMTACADFDDTGAGGDTSGDSVQCRVYHLGVAGSDGDSSAAVHCPHADLDGGGVCIDVPVPPTCAVYCTDISANCAGDNAQYADEAACLSYCETWGQLPAGALEDTSGNTIGCRTYHAGVAATDADAAALHCPHSGPDGANVCGTWCENYCHLTQTNCTGDNELYADNDACMTACGDFTDTGASGDTGGDSVQCRTYHAGVAGSDGDTSAAVHCGHAGIDGNGVCVADGTAGDTCDNTFAIGAMPFSTTGDTTGFTNASAGCGLGGAGTDNVYTLNTTEPTTYTIVLNSTVDSAIYVVDGCTDGVCLGENDAGGTDIDETVVVSLPADSSVFVVVDYWSNSTNAEGTYTLNITAEACVLACDGKNCGDDACGGNCGACAEGDVCDETQNCVEAPPGEICAMPWIVDVVPYSHDGNTETTNTIDDYSNAGCTDATNGAGSPDAAYEFTPTETGIYTISKVGSGGPALIYVTSDCSDIATSCVGTSGDVFSGGDLIVSLESGTTYFIIVDGWFASDDGAYTLTISEPCFPSCDGLDCGNDGCGSSCGTCAEGEACQTGLCEDAFANGGDTCEAPFAIAGDALPFVYSGITTGFTDGTSCTGAFAPGEGQSDFIFAFTADIDGLYDFVVESDFDTGLYIMTDCADPASCIDDDDAVFGGGTTELLDQVLVSGETYFIVVDGDASSTGAFTLTVEEPCIPSCDGFECGDDGCGLSCGECPEGDACESGSQICVACETAEGNTCTNPFIVDAMPYSTTGDTTGFCNSLSGCNLGGGGRDAVYELTAVDPTTYTVTLVSTVDSALYLLGTCDEPTSCLGSDDAVGTNSTETVEVSVAAGDTIYIGVDYWSNSGDVAGPYTLDITAVTCVPACDGKVCGDDLCGGNCGECGETQVCSAAGDACPEAAPGDICSGAIFLDAANLPISETGATDGLTNSTSCPAAFSGGGDSGSEIIYEFIPAVDGVYTVSADTGGAEFDSFLYIQTTCGEGASCTDYDDETFGGGVMTLEGLNWVAGNSYFIVIDGEEGATGSYTLTIPEPCIPSCDGFECGDDGCGTTCGDCEAGFLCAADQLCLDETTIEGNTCDFPYIAVLDAGTYTFTGDNFVNSNTQSGCSLGGGGNDAVFEFQAPESGTYTFTLNADADTAIYINTTCTDPATCVASEDEIGSNIDEIVTWDLVADEVVFVGVDYWSNSSSTDFTYTLTIELTGPPPT